MAPCWAIPANGSSHCWMRTLTCASVDPTATAPAEASSRPKTIQLVRSVATYSMTTNRPKYSSVEPRSVSRTRIIMLSAHIARIGPRSRPRGRYSPRKRRLASASASRLTMRYPAKKTVRMIFANSPGWMDPTPGMTIHSLAPFTAGKNTGAISSTSAVTPEM